jgi:dTDP-4-amino-4,6-dideoxygalactose transaminase
MNDFNISVDELEKKLRLTNKKKLPKLIILTHLGGVPCDLKKINKLSKKYKFKIIEDASHALGSKYFDTRIGSCKYSDITVFSFHPVKTITTGEGGCCTTNSEKLSKKITLLRSHGINRDIKKKNKPPFFYDQNILGYNYRLSDINCALGISQLRRVEKIVNKRNTVAKYYRKNLISKKFTFQIIEKKNVSSQHLFIIRLIDRKLIKKQLNIIQDLLKLNITVSIHYYPIYLLKFFKKMGFNQGYCKNAEDYYKSSFSIPNFEMITRKQQDYVISNFKKVILKYS